MLSIPVPRCYNEITLYITHICKAYIDQETFTSMDA